jgi:solute carrier family 25 phosphate transporter 23/24/25/41
VTAIKLDAGIQGFWRGNFANVVKSMPESAIRFLVYEKVNKTMMPGDNPVSERFVAGCLAGGFAQICVYPLEVVKTRLAVSSVATYSGLGDCLWSTFRSEGARSLCRGLGPALLSIVPAAGVDLAVYNTLRSRYKCRSLALDERGSAPEMPILISLSFGAIAGAAGALTAYPLTVVRTRLVAQGMPGREVQYAGMMDCFRCMCRTDGVSGLYRGLTPALLKTIPAVSTSYAAFETSKRIGNELGLGLA